RHHHHRDLCERSVLLCRGLSSAISSQESGGLLRSRRHRSVLPNRRRRQRRLMQIGTARPASRGARSRSTPNVNYNRCKTRAVSLWGLARGGVAAAFRLPIRAAMTALALSGCMRRTAPVAVAPQPTLDSIAYAGPAPVVVAAAPGPMPVAYAGPAPAPYDVPY